jgi:pyroglutamyl-peptidase
MEEMADCDACEVVVLRVKTCADERQTTDVRISEDAGRYLCDFIYYSSLAHLTKKEEQRRVVFLHVPVDSDEASIKLGTEVTIELIRALVQSGRLKKAVNQD